LLIVPRCRRNGRLSPGRHRGRRRRTTTGSLTLDRRGRTDARPCDPQGARRPGPTVPSHSGPGGDAHRHRTTTATTGNLLGGRPGVRHVQQRAHLGRGTPPARFPSYGPLPFNRLRHQTIMPPQQQGRGPIPGPRSVGTGDHRQLLRFIPAHRPALVLKRGRWTLQSCGHFLVTPTGGRPDRGAGPLPRPGRKARSWYTSNNCFNPKLRNPASSASSPA